MTDDLVTRLRWLNTNIHSGSPLVPAFQCAVAEAADEIERLQASIMDCQKVRDEWCAAYTELRDNLESAALTPKVPT